jgi:molybdopterin converting factor subunit 1
MRVRVLLFSQMRIQAGTEAVTLDLEPGARLEDAIAALHQVHPELRELGRSCMTAVGLEYAAPDHVLSNGDEISLIPPVSGG